MRNFFLYILVFFVFIVLLGSCAPYRTAEQHTVTLVTTDTVVRDRLIPVPTPEDSAQILALMRCDEHGRVLLSWYEQQVSRNAELEFSLDSLGRLLARFRTRPDTVYVEVQDTTIHRKEQTEETTTVTVEVEKPLTRWQNYLQVCGMIFNILLVVFATSWFLKKS